jgi:hypothetical protein
VHGLHAVLYRACRGWQVAEWSPVAGLGGGLALCSDTQGFHLVQLMVLANCIQPEQHAVGTAVNEQLAAPFDCVEGASCSISMVRSLP